MKFDDDHMQLPKKNSEDHDANLCPTNPTSSNNVEKECKVQTTKAKSINQSTKIATLSLSLSLSRCLTFAMGLHSLYQFLFFFLLVPLISLLSLPHPVLCHCKRPPVIFNFGDSNSDTGGLVAGLGFPVNFPNGRSFFRRSTGRLCDGRLLIDLLCKWALFITIFF